MRVLALALLVGLLVACTAPGSSASPPVSEAEARAVALSSIGSSTPPQVLSARPSTYGAESPNGSVVAAATPVWSVLVAGSFPFSCGPYTATPHPCPPPATTERVLVDALTGSFIEGHVPGT